MLEVRTNPSSSSDTGMTVEYRTHGPRPEPLQCGCQCEPAIVWNGVGSLSPLCWAPAHSEMQARP